MPITFSRGPTTSRSIRKDKKLLKQVGDAYIPYMECKLDYWERQSAKLFGREITANAVDSREFY